MARGTGFRAGDRAGVMAQLIDRFMPEYDAAKTHALQVSAPPAAVFARALEFDMAASPLVRLLFHLRGLGHRQNLRDLAAMGFITLGQRQDEEILLGLVGRFWTLGGDIQRLSADQFVDFTQVGFARATWNFSVANKGDGTLLKTETRIACTDAVSRRRFLRYWRVVGPFSGLIRRRLLRGIKNRAEDTRI